MQNDALKPTQKDKFLQATEVRYLLGDISPSIFYKMIKDGKFPQPIKLSQKVLLYKQSWVDRLLELDAGTDLDSFIERKSLI